MQLLVEVLERRLERAPKVDLLQRTAGARVPVEPRHGLHGAHPPVHVCVQLVDKRVIQRIRQRRTAVDHRRNARVHRQLNLRNIDVLLQVSQRELELGHLALHERRAAQLLVVFLGLRGVCIEPRRHHAVHYGAERLARRLE